jgi:phage-related protein
MGNQYRLDTWRRHNREGFKFGEVDSLDYGVYITGTKVGGAPKRDVSFIQVPGRNGDLLLDNNRWHNIEVTYSCAIITSFYDRFDRFKNKLLSQTGYHRLHDTIYPAFFRVGALVDGIDPNTFRLNKSGTFDITFTCKPQRYDWMEGDRTHRFTESPATYYYFGAFPANPLITIYGTGSGTLTIGSRTVEILNIDEQLILDCETMNAYKQVGEAPAENKNADIYAPEFPVLEPGELNTISWTGDITSVEIISKGWII